MRPLAPTSAPPVPAGELPNRTLQIIAGDDRRPAHRPHPPRPSHVLGTLVTGDPDKARVAGFLIRLGVGVGFAPGYATTFALVHSAT